MILARVVSATREGELSLAFARMGLPRSTRDYLLEKIVGLHLMFTGLSSDDRRLLRTVCRSSEAPGYEEFPSWAPGDTGRQDTCLLSGRKDQFENLLDELGERAPEVGKALAHAMNANAPLEPLTVGGRRFDFGSKTHVVGVLNVTPDSFSDGGKFTQLDAALAQAEAMVRAGAEIIDVGGESTRPGAAEVSAADELARVLPVIEAVHQKLPEVPLSVDTTKAKVAAKALEAGASMVNDITGFAFDPELASVAAQAGAAACVMHIQGTPRTMQHDPKYGDVVEDVLASLEASLERGEKAGLPRNRMLADPGIGFGKTLGHNLFLLRRLNDLRQLRVPILVGTSRKSFLGRLTGKPVASERVAASVASVAAIAAQGGADFVRVHDVEETLDAVKVADALRAANEGGDFYLAGKAVKGNA